MITKPFAAGEVVGKVRQKNSANDSFETAIYTIKLQSCYPEFRALLESAFTAKDGEDGIGMNVGAIARPEVQVALTASATMSEFCEVAPRIVELHTPDSQLWKRADFATAEEVKGMFRFWREELDFREAVQAALVELDRPNGVAGAAKEQLTEDEKRDPLFSSSGSNGTLESAKSITT